MQMSEIAQKLDLHRVTSEEPDADRNPTGAYTSDMLSCVMAGAPHGGIWVTLQAHANIVAVAALLELAAVVITEGAEPDEATVSRANEKQVPLYTTSMTSYEVAGKLWDLGIRNS